MRYVIKEAKKTQKKSIVYSINSNTNITQVWKKAKFLKQSKTNHHSRIGLEKNNQIVTDPALTSNIFVETFAAVSDPTNYDEAFLSDKNALEQEGLDFQTPSEYGYNKLFSIEELTQAMSQITRTTAAGKDNLIYPFISHLNSQNKHKLLNYFNYIWKTGQFPSNWKLSILIPIFKQGKVATDPSSYRPIALTSCLCKIMERMVLQRLLNFFTANRVINVCQSGFRKKFSTMDSLIRLEGDIRETFLHGEYLTVLFLDIDKAYNRTWTHGIMRKLSALGLRGSSAPIYTKFYI